MNFYPFHIGDYATHTAHLEPMEDLAFRRLMDLYYLREAALPADVQECARLIRMKGNAQEVEAVLKEFFLLTNEGWMNVRCSEEIGNMKDKQAKARAAAQASVNARSASAQRTLNEGSATNTNTITNTKVIQSATPPAPVDKSKPKRKTQLPDGFAVSPNVEAWAKERGFGQLAEHLDAFTRKAQAKAYTYADWDLAFMEAIREDWGKLRGRTANGSAPIPDDTTRAGSIAAELTKKMLDERDKGTKPMSSHIREQINKALRKEAA